MEFQPRLQPRQFGERIGPISALWWPSALVSGFFNFLIFLFVVDFVIHWNETAMGLHVFFFFFFKLRLIYVFVSTQWITFAAVSSEFTQHRHWKTRIRWSCETAFILTQGVSLLLMGRQVKQLHFYSLEINEKNLLYVWSLILGREACIYSLAEKSK